MTPGLHSSVAGPGPGLNGLSGKCERKANDVLALASEPCVVGAKGASWTL